MKGLDVINTYQDRLDSYSVEQLRYRIKPESWSIGQVYSHIVDVALEYLDNMQQCLVSDCAQPLGKTTAGEELFRANAFPPIKIKLPEGMEYSPDDSKTNAEHQEHLNHLIEKMRDWDKQIPLLDPQSKVRHGGFGWLNASEWFELIDMHTRHHLRQIKEIEGQWNKMTLDR
ncbi:DinB family protein [Paenibacillus glycanilyticus]|uniref:DinB family protein n=1 Tax=Paenibacillus glycanilyticus TaxID=126569 RepID=UPI00204252B1|nr:DinB family protein [Paenibacillus glycanilyticus]MCM3628572.1 DinB family protein [Paenibacillus glycanilyticus]